MGDKKGKSVNLRRNRRTTISHPAVKVTTEWDDDKREWKVIVESADAVINHCRLSDKKPNRRAESA